MRVAHLSRYNDQKDTTAKTCILRNWTEGRPRTWSARMDQLDYVNLHAAADSYLSSLSRRDRGDSHCPLPGGEQIFDVLLNW